jgi:hypothetical protein
MPRIRVVKAVIVTVKKRKFEMTSRAIVTITETEDRVFPTGTRGGPWKYKLHQYGSSQALAWNNAYSTTYTFTGLADGAYTVYVCRADEQGHDTLQEDVKVDFDIGVTRIACVKGVSVAVESE